jgi:hypothetical protein
MRIRNVVTVAALVGATFVATRAVYSQEKGEAPKEPTPEEIMKIMAERAALAPEHAELARAAGEWEGDVVHWVGGPEPVKSKGSASSRLMVGGRLLVTEFRGEMMGQKFEGFAIEGYDKNKKEWFNVWVDSMDTGHMRSTGKTSPEGVRTYVSEMCDWGMGPMKMRMTNEWKDSDTMEMVGFCSDASGAEQKVMQIVYKRKK